MAESRPLKRIVFSSLSIVLGVGLAAEAVLAVSNGQSPRISPTSLRLIELLFMWLFGPEVGAFVGSYLALLLGATLVTLGFVGLRNRDAS